VEESSFVCKFLNSWSIFLMRTILEALILLIYSPGEGVTGGCLSTTISAGALLT